MVFIWNRNTLNGKLYFNGKKVGDQTSSYKGPDTDLKLTNHTMYEIGFKKDTGEVLHGSLRDLALFLRALTPGDVFRLYSKFFLSHCSCALRGFHRYHRILTLSTQNLCCPVVIIKEKCVFIHISNQKDLTDFQFNDTRRRLCVSVYVVFDLEAGRYRFLGENRISAGLVENELSSLVLLL